MYWILGLTYNFTFFPSHFKNRSLLLIPSGSLKFSTGLPVPNQKMFLNRWANLGFYAIQGPLESKSHWGIF